VLLLYAGIIRPDDALLLKQALDTAPEMLVQERIVPALLVGFVNIKDFFLFERGVSL